MQEIKHHGILGMRWGVRRSPDELRRLNRKDERWAKKNTDRITKKASKKVAKEMAKHAKELMKDPSAVNKSGKLSAATINAYNRKMASLMTEQVSSIRSPSGKVVSFVAKRGEIGVMMAISDQGYNINRLKNGVYSSGKVAYRGDVLDKIEHSEKHLYHHGVKGMKWGVRKEKRYTNDSVRDKIGLQFFAKRAKSRKTILLKPSEYAHVMHEVATWITEEQKKSPVFSKSINQYTYTFSNSSEGYRVIGKKKIPGTSSKIYERGRRK